MPASGSGSGGAVGAVVVVTLHLAPEPRLHAVGDRVVEVAQRGEQRLGVARELEHLVEPFAHRALGARRNAAAPAAVTASRNDRRSPATASRVTSFRVDEPVDRRGHGRLGERETLGHERRALGAGRDEREHAVLGEGEVAGRVLERAGGEGEAPHGPGPRRVGGRVGVGRHAVRISNG